MKRNASLYVGLSLLLAFVAWCVLVCTVDVQAIGPSNSSVGFATLNAALRGLCGTNMTLYTVTDWLGLVPIFTALGFAILGLVELIKRRSLIKVDRSVLVLGAFYIVVIFVYLFFENVVINYRPVLIDGRLEASYPSSTTMLVMTVMPTAAIEIGTRVKKTTVKWVLNALIAAFVAFMVIGRILSGVHWITDIIGGALFSSGLVLLYDHFK